MLLYDGQKVDSNIIPIDSAQIFSGLRELRDPNWHMNSVEMVLPYAGHKLDSYIVPVDSAQIFCGLHEPQ